MSPLPNFAGGGVELAAPAMPGVSALRIAPPLSAAPPVRPAFFRNESRVSPSTA